MLHVKALSAKQLQTAVKLFDEISAKPLLPLHEIDSDATREELDSRFARDVLGLAAPTFASGWALELLRMKLAREPSIRGHKVE